MEFVQTISVPVIAGTVYGILSIAKNVIKSERFKMFIPLVASVLGSLFGIMLYIGFPEMIPAPNLCAALIIGAASGWAATGAHQTGKQLKGANND